MKKVYRDVAVWDSSREKAEVCDVVTESGIIKSIQPAGSISYGCAYEGRGKTALLPGFVNAHGHAAMTLLRGFGEDLPLMKWLNERIWPAEARLNASVVYTGTQLAIMEMLATGTTCYADMYFFMGKVADASIEAGIRCGLSRGIICEGENTETKIKEGIQLIRDYNGAKGLVNAQLGPHASYTVTLDFAEKIAKAAAEYGVGIQLHWLETDSDWPNTKCSNEMTPEDYLEKSGLIYAKELLLAHGVYIDKAKFDFYARDNVTVAHNPKSNLKLGSGIAPVAGLLKSGVNVALGTDGAASNNRLDMWDEMRFAALLQKGACKDPTLMTLQEIFKMATLSGAKALGFTNTGLIKEGYAADFMLVDLDQPHYIGWNCDNLPGYIIYAGSSSDVKGTVVAGNMLYNGGEYTTIDKYKVLREARTAYEFLSHK